MSDNRLIHVLPLVLAAAALAACTPAAPASVPATLTVAAGTAAAAPQASAAPTATETPPAATATSEPPAATAASTAAPLPGTVVSFNGVQVTVPAAAAGGASGRLVPASEQAADMPEFAINPAYTELTLTGYPSQNTYFKPAIQVYSVAEYGKMSQVAAERVKQLQALLAEHPAAPPKTMPMLPVFNAAQIIRARVQYLSFQNGTGVRFLTQHDQAFMPINNQELVYTFQGLTADGAYYISAILPVSAPFLPNEWRPEATPPAGGVPFPKLEGADPTPDFEAYLHAVAQKLEAAPAGQLTPNLDGLDALVQSLQVAAP